MNLKILSGISSTVLAELELLELEREGLVTKKIYPEIPPEVEYALTMRAKELEVILKELARWASRCKSASVSKTMTTIAVGKNRLERPGGWFCNKGE